MALTTALDSAVEDVGDCFSLFSITSRLDYTQQHTLVAHSGGHCMDRVEYASEGNTAEINHVSESTASLKNQSIVKPSGTVSSPRSRGRDARLLTQTKETLAERPIPQRREGRLGMRTVLDKSSTSSVWWSESPHGISNANHPAHQLSTRPLTKCVLT